MLFSAGLGVGIVFWGVAEPLTHYLHSPFPKDVPNQSAESARVAMGYTFTVMGIATSIGLGIMQISGGLNHVFHVPNNNVTKLLLRYSWFVFS